jgi:hypothetical protein
LLPGCCPRYKTYSRYSSHPKKGGGVGDEKGGANNKQKQQQQRESNNSSIPRIKMRSWAERERKKGQLLARSLKAPLENNHKRTSLVTRQQAPRFESTAFKRRPKHKRLSGADRTQTRQHVTSTTLLHTSLAPFKKKNEEEEKRQRSSL